MPDPAADRNLLFGILALQMDFVSRDALIASMNAWVLDKAKPLGQVLREQGKLTEDEHALLEALVRKHLEKHGNDPERSLAALGPVGLDLRQVADPGVQASLAHVSASRSAPDPDATRADTASPAARRFLILRPHARGGLGEVFVARDEELHREVALKEIQEQHADNRESRARFLLEAEVTGGLEHPGIVPVYGLGHYGDGRPFYAMRFIKGDSLKHAIHRFHKEKPTLPAGERVLRLRQLLGRFVDVCQAVAYAHSRGVLHRDLKPANIMLGKYGETLVLDWGLAKVTGQADVEVTGGLQISPADSALTQAGRALGTPAYMSPEQAAGRLDQLGPRSDVYSLGATLYCVLTGRPPFAEKEVGEVLARVRRGDCPRPRELDRQIHPALEAICRKAMALAPEARYPSPQVLAEDLEKYLADEPVTAYRAPLPARLARWGRRHRTLVTTTVLVLLTLMGTAVAGWLIVGREQERTRALAQADSLEDAEAAAVPALLQDLARHRADVLPRLRERWQDKAAGDRQRLRLGLALADDAEVRARLVDLARTAEDPQEVLLVRDALVPHAAEVAPMLWGQVGERPMPGAERLRLLAMLATLDRESGRWKDVAGNVVTALVHENLLRVPRWAEALRPVGGQLVPALAAACRDAGRPEAERDLVTSLLADYAADRPEVLADLAMDADAKQFAVLYPPLRERRDETVARLGAELDRQADGSEEVKEQLAKRQANAAVALLRLGHSERVWPLLQYRPDPRLRSYLIHRLSPLEADARSVVGRLAEEPDVSAKRALLLCLGEFTSAQFPPAERKALVPGLLKVYRDDPDPGLHGAAEWLLRQWQQGDRLRDIDKELATGKVEGLRRWYVNGQGQTLALIDAGEFLMGSPRTEAGRYGGADDLGEMQHRRRVGRTFALATKDVTVAQFLRFRKDYDYSKQNSPTPEHPVNSVPWYDAAAYCNWLSKEESIAEDQWCYLPNKAVQYAEGMRMKPGYLSLAGYRLPTEAEWEYACRAGAVTSRYYGETEELLGKYAWYAKSSQDKGMLAPGGLKPNDLGLFDMLGNAWQWCQHPVSYYPHGRHGEPCLDKEFEKDIEDIKGIQDRPYRVLRGGGFSNQAVAVRSATRISAPPGHLNYYIGFRPARTCR
jgi:formylglycine-generating enzyme required for sulfatase activity/tRNA A-37 threonylcarbamoyl transferase component Bud32